MKVLLKYYLQVSGHAVGDCQIGWFRDGGAVLLRLLLRVGYVEKV